MNRKKNFLNLIIEGTKNNKMMLLVKFKHIVKHPKITCFTETGKMILHLENNTSNNGYVVLAIIQSYGQAYFQNFLNFSPC